MIENVIVHGSNSRAERRHTTFFDSRMTVKSARSRE
jgi:hypothetical protein